MSNPLRFGIVAGEKSGDILGAGLIIALRQRFPDAEFVGLGGPEMMALGCRSLAAMDRLSVMGFVEPLGRLPELLKIKKDLQNYFYENPPAAFIGIDSPDFNLLLEKNFRKRGIKTVHYVSPSVWAYREKRIHKIKKAVDLMLTLFPFEQEIYRQHDIAVACVGHPLADTIDFEDRKTESRQALGLQQQDTVVALMPGSRGGEIKRLGPIFLAAALESLQQSSSLKFVIPCSGVEARAQIKALLRQLKLLSTEQFILVDDSHLAISGADLVLLASGTATLEAMLLRRPMIVCYKLAWLTYEIASRLVKVPYVALPNLLAGKQLVPEYIQRDVSVATLCDQIIEFTSNAPDPSLLEEFDIMHRKLRLDASAQAAQAIADLIEQST